MRAVAKFLLNFKKALGSGSGIFIIEFKQGFDN